MALTIDRHQLEISNRGNVVISNARLESKKNRVGSTSTDLYAQPGRSAQAVKSAPRQTRTISALGLIALMLSLLAVFVPSGQFEVAILAAILASVAGFCGELIYTTLTAAVTAVNMSLLIPHDDVVMTERPIQIYWTALEWSLAPAVAMILGYFNRLLVRKGPPPSRHGSEQPHEPNT
jgi:hypothetical protein